MAARHGVPRSSARGEGSRTSSRSRDRVRPRTRDTRPAEDDVDSDLLISTGEHDDFGFDARPLRDCGRREISRTLRGKWMNLDAKRAVVLALVISVVALTLAMPLRTYFSQRSEFEQLRSSNQELTREIGDYQRKVNEQSDPAYIEAQARDRLRFVRPGETPLVMLYPDDDARRAAQAKEQERANTPWYGNLWESIANPPNSK